MALLALGCFDVALPRLLCSALWRCLLHLFSCFLRATLSAACMESCGLSLLRCLLSLALGHVSACSASPQPCACVCVVQQHTDDVEKYIVPSIFNAPDSKVGLVLCCALHGRTAFACCSRGWLVLPAWLLLCGTALRRCCCW